MFLLLYFKKMTIYSGATLEYDVLFYKNGVFTDLQYIDKEVTTELKYLMEERLRSGDFDTMTFVVRVSIKNRLGKLFIDAEQGDDLNRFQDTWTFPYMKKLSDVWDVIINMTHRTDYDEDGNEIPM